MLADNYVVSYNYCLLYLDYSDVLDLDDLKHILRTTWEARRRWYNIGLALNISPYKIDVIKHEYASDPGDCLREILMLWLKESVPTWKEMIEVLRSPMVGFEHIAENIIRERTM